MTAKSAFRRAAIFGASGGIGQALGAALEDHGTEVWAGSRSGAVGDRRFRDFHFDLTDESSIAAAAKSMSVDPPDLVIVASGVLTLADGDGPERTFRKIHPTAMDEILRINAVGPAIVAKHMLPLLPRDRASVFAALSARVGSISDNELGGWHSYRASKAALNMLLKNFAIEMKRTHKLAAVVGLHPGTVDTELSRPFQSNLPEGQLVTVSKAAANLLAVINGLEPSDSGKVLDWQGEVIPP